MLQAEQPKSSTKAKILLVEDHPVVRRGLANLINDEPDLQVCGGAETIAQSIDAIASQRPDVVIVDITLGEESGLELIKQIQEKNPQLPILALSMHDEALYAERAIRAGARGYIMKKEAMDKVLIAIRRVLAGEIYLSEKAASRMVHKFIHPTGAQINPSPEALSDREFEVFSLIAQGVGPTEMAKRLKVSVKTVETHREHIKKKLGLTSGAELIRFALQWTNNQHEHR